MPRIPIYEQQIVPNSLPANVSISPQRSGLEAIGAGLGDIASGMMRVQQEREQADAVVYATKAAGEADSALTQWREEYKATSPAGADGFTDAVLKQHDDHWKTIIEAADTPAKKQRVALAQAQSREWFARTSMEYQANERIRKNNEDIGSLIDTTGKLVYGSPETFEQRVGAANSAISAARIEPADRERQRENLRKTAAWYAVIGQIEKDPAKEPKGSAWNMLNADEQMKARGYAEQKMQKGRQELATSIRYDIEDAAALASVGVAPNTPARSRGEFGIAFENPEVADREYARYMTARQTGAAVQSMTGKTTAELVSVMQAQPDASSPNLAAEVSGQRIQAQAAEQIIKQRQADPIGYAMRTGDFGISPLDPNDQAAFGEQLRRRTAAQEGMREKYGFAEVLSPPEAEMLGQRLDQLPAEMKITELEKMRQSVSDDRVYSGMLNSIRPDSPVTALVGNIATVSKDNARMIARGEDLLNPSKAAGGANGKGGFPMPTETSLRTQWVAMVGDAYRGFPDAEQTAYQAYRAYYAAAASKAGLYDPAAPSTELMNEAVKAATGGVMNWDTAFFSGTAEARVVLPYGMDEQVFRDKVASAWNAQRDALGYSETEWNDIALMNTGANGEYQVMSGTSWLADKDQKPVILRIQ